MNAPTLNAPFVRSESVTYRYRGGGTSDMSAPAVREVSLAVRAGELLGLVGPNGSGKSTLLKLFAGLFAPTTGSVLYDGSPLSARTRRHRARLIAYVPQEATLDFELSVADVVAMGRLPHLRPFSAERASDREAVRLALQTTGLLPLAGRSVTRLSGGERQRVLIARALAQESPVLLLDEPTAHLDIHHQAQLFSLLERLRLDKGITILIILHDLNLAAQYCDRLALLGGGELLQCGAPQQVIAPMVLRRAYGSGLSVSVAAHPLTGRPIVLPDVSGIPVTKDTRAMPAAADIR